MSFLNPFALFFLLLGLPIIVLYLLKQRRQQVKVSSLLFWEEILKDEQTTIAVSKLKKWISLLMQLAFLLLLALAIGHPFLSDKITGARRIVLIVDNSASMLVQEDSQSRFDSALDHAKRIVRQMNDSDELMLVAMNNDLEVTVPPTNSKREVLDALNALKPIATSTALHRLPNLLQNLPPAEKPTHIYVVSDGAIDAIDLVPEADQFFTFIPVGQETDNIGITAFQVRPLPASPKDFEIFVQAANYTANDHKVPLEITLNGSLLDVIELDIPAGQTITHNFRQVSESGGQIEAYLDFEDAFALDNRGYAVIPRLTQQTVYLVAPPRFFVETALLSDPNIRLQTIAPEQYAQDPSIVGENVAVFAGWAPQDIPAGNSIFIGTWPEALPLTQEGTLTNPIITEWETDHPILQHLKLRNITIERSYQLSGTQNFTTLASSFGQPLILLRETAQRKMLITTFDSRESDLPLKVAFPILITNAIRYLSGQLGETTWQSPVSGALLTHNELERFNTTNGSIQQIELPDNSAYTVDSQQPVLSVSKPGFYTYIDAEGTRTPLFGASLSTPRESNIAPNTQLPIAGNVELPVIEYSSTLGHSPWFYLVFIGLMLSFAEWFLFHRRVIE